MRTYTVTGKQISLLDGERVHTETGITLHAMAHITDWTPEEFDDIANLEIGEWIKFDACTVTRT